MLQGSHDRALVLYIAENSGGADGLGKKAIQKLVHLVTDIGRVPSGYEFSLYTYGPYSRDLSDDIELLESLGALDIKYQAQENKYEIRPGGEAGRFLSHSMHFLAEYADKIDGMLKFFSGRTARSLEMTSTLLFVLRQKENQGIADEDLVNKFRVIKPHFSKSEALRALAELKSLLSDQLE